MEDRIIVDFSALDRIAKRLNDAGNELNAAMSLLAGASLTRDAGAYQRVSSNCALKTVGGSVNASTVAQAVSGYRSALGRVELYSRSLSTAVRTASGRFRNTERSLSGNISGISPGESAPTSNDQGASKESSTGTPLISASDLWKLVGQFGIVGSGISVIGGLITGGISVKSGLTAAKGLSSFIGNIAKASSASSFDWRTLFGFNPIDLSKSSSNFFTEFGNQMNKYNFGNATKVSEKIAVGAKWAGNVFTVATTAYDNYGDYKSGEMGLGRAVAETIGESAVKIGEGIALTAGATAICAALGVAAPAVVIGGAVVVATWAIDKGFEAMTGKNFAEWASDTVLDTAGNLIEGVGNAVNNFVDNVGSAARRAGNAISGWWNSTFNGGLSIAW